MIKFTYDETDRAMYRILFIDLRETVENVDTLEITYTYNPIQTIVIYSVQTQNNRLTFKR